MYVGRQLRRVISVLALSALLLSACSEDPATPEGFPAPSPAPTGGAFAESDEPSAEPEPETAKEFIRRFVRLQNEMQLTGDTEAYRAVSGDCQNCLEFADQVQGIYESGGFIKTEGWAISDFISTHGKRPKSRVHVLVISRPTKYALRDGAPIKSLPGGRLKQRFELRLISSEWVLLDNSELAS